MRELKWTIERIMFCLDSIDMKNMTPNERIFHTNLSMLKDFVLSGNKSIEEVEGEHETNSGAVCN